MGYLEINQLSELIKDSIPCKKLKILGEISSPKLSQGNMYLSLKDKNASINAIIFKKYLENINEDIKEGDKVIVKGRLNYWEKTGSISIIIIKIIKYMGKGDFNKIYLERKKLFEKKGYFLDKHKLKIPVIIKNILILTAKTGAALQDFIFTLENNNSKLKYELLNITVQGKNCSKNICEKLNDIDKKYDLIVITRGGGNKDNDLFQFNDVKLIETVFNFKQPILSAIGHQVNEVLLDLVADAKAPTPSLASQFIIDQNKKFIKKNNDYLNKIYRDLHYKLDKKSKKIKKYTERLNDQKKYIIRTLQRIKDNYLRIIINFPNSKLRKINNLYNIFYKHSKIFIETKYKTKEKLKNQMTNHLKMLENFKNSISIKQDISLYSNGKKIISPLKLNKKIIKNKKIKLIWDNFEYNANLTLDKVIIKQLS